MDPNWLWDTWQGVVVLGVGVIIAVIILIAITYLFVSFTATLNAGRTTVSDFRRTFGAWPFSAGALVRSNVEDELNRRRRRLDEATVYLISALTEGNPTEGHLTLMIEEHGRRYHELWEGKDLANLLCPTPVPEPAQQGARQPAASN